jgi:iron complex transport system substrate-binding protein
MCLSASCLFLNPMVYLLNSLKCSFVLLLAIALFAQCAPSTQLNQGEWSVCYLPRHAKGFQIRVNQDSSLFNVLLFGTKGDTIKNWNFPTHQHRKTVCLSTTHIPFFQSIGALDQVVGVGFADLIKNQEVISALQSGKITNISKGEDISKEVLLGLMPDQFLIYSYGDKDYSFYSTMGIEVIPIAEYLETTPLARSEWLVLIGALAGEFDRAKIVFTDLEGRYTQLKDQTKTLPRPKVITGYYNSGHWYAPPGNSFVAHFLDDAGGHYIWKDSLSNANIVVPFETLFAAMEESEFWGKLAFTAEDPTRATFAGDVPQLAELDSYQRKKLFFCNTQRTDYFGDAVMQPDVILRDLIHIFHPELQIAHPPVYFQPL